MIINKITTGYVIQSYDTDEKRWLGQDFVAGEVEWENEIGESLELDEIPDPPYNSYLPFNMEQSKDE